MTKYFKENIKGTQYADRPIAIASSEDDEDEEIICPSCPCNTVVKVDTDDYCTRCQRTFNVKQDVEIEIETGKIVESDNMDDNPEPLVSYGEDPDARFYKDKKPEYQGTFNALQDRGIHIISYTERSGDGRITSSWNDGSYSSSGSDRKMSAPRPTRFTEDRDSEE